MAIYETFKGKIALVTGAASGIGAGCARWLDTQGIGTLILVDRDADGLAALDLSCETRIEAGDVSDPELWSRLESDWGHIDHAVVNAGIGSGGAIPDISFEDWRRVMAVNLDGAFLTLSAAMRSMKTNGGSIVVVASTTGVKAVQGIGPYGVSKAGAAHMARIAALDGAADGIRVNAIAPGGVDTAIWDSSDDFKQAEAAHGRDATLLAMAKTTPRGKFATADEIAGDVGYLLSEAASNVTGTVLVSDGGFTL